MVHGSTTTVRYFTLDHIGTPTAITKEDGTLAERDVYDAWGKQRNLDGTADTACALPAADFSNRGFTGHEEMPDLCLINMNARIYDPTIGRFLTPDDVIQDEYDGQSYNRYTYVDNNPLSYDDPTGHMVFTLVWEGAEAGCMITAEIGCFEGALAGAGIGLLATVGGYELYEHRGSLLPNKSGEDGSGTGPGAGHNSDGGTPELPEDQKQPSGGPPKLPPPIIPPTSLTPPSNSSTAGNTSNSGSTSNTGRQKNFNKPDNDAEGDHSTFRRDANGDVSHTTTWGSNPRKSHQVG